MTAKVAIDPTATFEVRAYMLDPDVRPARNRHCLVSGVPAKVDLLIRMLKGATMMTHVTETAAAPSELAVKHFQEMLAFETDCWDVHEGLKTTSPDFIVVDVRGPN